MPDPQPKRPPEGQPEAPAKPGARKPVDPAVYGTQWGDSGGQKPPGPQPSDRPDKIKAPREKN